MHVVSTVQTQIPVLQGLSVGLKYELPCYKGAHISVPRSAICSFCCGTCLTVPYRVTSLAIRETVKTFDVKLTKVNRHLLKLTDCKSLQVCNTTAVFWMLRISR